MERAPWFVVPEVLLLGQVAGVAVFLVALVFTLTQRRLAQRLVGKVRSPAREVRFGAKTSVIPLTCTDSPAGKLRA